ncbi:MAG: LysR family transcriptional regulator substrate-binding protein [Litoreibacter sp.]|nr:LysR family transcriptional regulator substrate-binding protein [Litoreibacter sp.]
MLPHARSIVSQVKQVSLVARTNSALETPKIVVGDNAQAYADGSVRSLVANLPEDLTSHLELRPKPHKGWVNGLIDGNADIGFFNEPPKGQSELRFEIAAVIPLVCAMSHDHDLSQLNVITPECFIGQNLIIPTQDRIGATKQAIQRRIEAQLHDIDVIEADQDWATILAMIECNIGVGLVPKTLAKANNETLRFVQFDDRPLNLAHYLAVVSRKWWKLFHGVSERLIVWLCYAARSRISLSG